jgi:hypothetical protein
MYELSQIKNIYVTTYILVLHVGGPSPACSPHPTKGRHQQRRRRRLELCHWNGKNFDECMNRPGKRARIRAIACASLHPVADVPQPCARRGRLSASCITTRAHREQAGCAAMVPAVAVGRCRLYHYGSGHSEEGSGHSGSACDVNIN